jgi:putative component of membrane protein insertase Oxa1/YidC/SpoIIIJ protein YidD
MRSKGPSTNTFRLQNRAQAQRVDDRKSVKIRNRNRLWMGPKWLLLFLPALLQASPGFRLPWGKDADLKYSSAAEAPPSPNHSLGVRLAETVIRFHQQVISPVDGPRSHFRPSSSAYMLDAMHKYGFVYGFVRGCDRLMRENSDPWVYRNIEENGQLFKYDPVR